MISHEGKVIRIFRGLIAGDDDTVFHRNHAELSYALSRQQPPDLEEAENEISKAIEIRDKSRIKGWQYYEVRRSRYRIQQDPNFNSNLPSEPALVERVLADLRRAASTEKWDRWRHDESDVAKWLTTNNIDPATLLPSKSTSS